VGFLGATRLAWCLPPKLPQNFGFVSVLSQRLLIGHVRLACGVPAEPSRAQNSVAFPKSTEVLQRQAFNVAPRHSCTVTYIQELYAKQTCVPTVYVID
jgi:hypothetical protein